MKLISCHIEGFGSIKNQDFSFNEGINCFFEKNGAGKSTLATFIKAMFYGLDGYKTNTKSFTDRKHYYPFDYSGGRFGGNLTFELNGDKYKIERFFGEKSDTTDEVKVYKNANETAELGDDIGKSVFSLDKASFERVAFITDSDVEIKATEGISDKLGRFLDGGEAVDVSGAIKELDELLKRFKKRGSGGEISAVKTEIEKIESDIQNAETIKENLKERYRELSEINETIEDLNARITRAQSLNVLREAYERYEGLLKEASDAEEKKNDLDNKYKKGVPNTEEIEKLQTLQDRLNEINGSLKQSAFSDDDRLTLMGLDKKFSQGVPAKERLNEIEGKISAGKELEGKIKTLSDQKLMDNERKLLQKFGQYCPDDEQASEISRLYDKYKELCAQRETEQQKGASKQKTSVSWLLIVALIIVVVGVVFISINALTGYIMTGLGLALAVFTTVMRGVSKNNLKNTEIELGNKARSRKNEIEKLIIQYGYDINSVETFLQDRSSYKEIESRESDRETKVSEKQDELSKISEELDNFFKIYEIPNNDLKLLVTEVNSYNDLKKRCDDAEEIKNELNEKKEALQRDIEVFKTRFDLSELDVKKLSADRTEYESLKNAIAEKKKEAENLKTEKGLSEKPADEDEDVDVLNDDYNEKIKDRETLERTIRDNEMTVDKLEEYRDKREELGEKLDEYNRVHELLTKTKELITESDKKIKDRYVKPVMDEYLSFSEMLESAIGEKITMNENFEIRLERGGKEREDAYLSSGQRAICALCFRLAVMKNIFGDNLPIVIMDDPFTSLDEEHLDRVKNMLKEISKDTQMIYFTCHESRAM